MSRARSRKAKPYTLHPKPYALNSQPRIPTPKPKPQTPNPQTPNPEPNQTKPKQTKKNDSNQNQALAALLEGVARDGGVAILRAWAGARPQKLTVSSTFGIISFFSMRHSRRDFHRNNFISDSVRGQTWRDGRWRQRRLSGIIRMRRALWARSMRSRSTPIP